MNPKFVLASLTVAGAIALSGCAGRRDFAAAVNAYTVEILPAYKRYVSQDADLDADSKRIRLRSADTFQKLVTEGTK